MKSLSAVDRLVACLCRLPGVGRRSAERMALRLVRDAERLIPELAAALEEVRRRVRACSCCGGLTEAGADPCPLCSSPARDAGVLCVVEDPNDIALIERAGAFQGRYHALMGRLSPQRGDGAADLRVDTLLHRIRREQFQEVILALSTDVEGDATASYLAEALKPAGVRVTRLAFGLPAGSGIAYSDAVTLERAIKGRQPA